MEGWVVRKARLRMSIRDLIIAIALVGLMLGHLADLFRTRLGRTCVTIRVFNKTSEDVGFLRYEWDTVARHVESHGENSGRVVIAPGGVTSFRVDLPGPVDFTLSCTTEGGGMSSGPVRIDAGGRLADALDFYVRPNGLSVRGATGVK
jgi:hypothetical protein